MVRRRICASRKQDKFIHFILPFFPRRWVQRSKYQYYLPNLFGTMRFHAKIKIILKDPVHCFRLGCENCCHKVAGKPLAVNEGRRKISELPGFTRWCSLTRLAMGNLERRVAYFCSQKWVSSCLSCLSTVDFFLSFSRTTADANPSR